MIVVYKLAKAAGQALLACALAVMILGGVAGHVHALAQVLRDHVIHPWSMTMADVLVSASAPRHVALGAVALALDAGVSAFEGWALHRRRWWGPWLVVVATGSLIPFEVYEIVRHVRVTRVAVLAINAAIVIYLAWRVLQDRKAPSD